MVNKIMRVGESIPHVKYNKNNWDFDYITISQFKQIEKTKTTEVHGYIHIESISQISDEYNSIYYFGELKEKEKIAKNEKLVGYVRLGEHIWAKLIDVRERNILIPCLIGICIAIGLCIIIGIGAWKSIGVETKSAVQQEIADGKDWNGQLPRSGEDSVANIDTIEIPGYTDLVVSKDLPMIGLINGDKNTVYCLYNGVKTLAFQAKPLGQPHNFKFRLNKSRDTKLEVRQWKITGNRRIVRMISSIT